MGAAPRPKVITQDGEPAVHFDLDALEHEARREPFRFTLGGEIFELCQSPEDVDWQIHERLADGGGLQDYLAELLGDDYDRFASHKLSAKLLNELIKSANAHFGVETGESSASPRSSNGTRRR